MAKSLKIVHVILLQRICVICVEALYKPMRHPSEMGLRVSLLLQYGPVERLARFKTVALRQVNALTKRGRVVHHLLGHATHVDACATHTVLFDDGNLLSVSAGSLCARQTT